MLAEGLGARHVVVGANFRYGQRAQGDTRSLRGVGVAARLHRRGGSAVRDRRRPVSSSRIRDLLAAGEVERRRALLGRPPWMEGAVVHGDGRGRELGFADGQRRARRRAARCPPWASTPASAIFPGARTRPAAISVGYNPTFSDSRERVRIEAHLLDFDGDVYGSPIRLDLIDRLRDEQRFGSVDELIAAVNADIARVRTLTRT